VQFEQVLQGEMPEDDHVEPIEQVTELLVFVELPQTVSAVAVQFDITILFAPVQFEQVLQGEMPEDDHVEPIEQVTELLVFVELPQTVSAVAVQFDITILFAPVQFEQVLQGEMPEDDHVEPIEQVTELLVFVELPQTVSAVAVQFDITILFAPVQFEQVLQGEMPEDDHVEPIEQVTELLVFVELPQTVSAVAVQFDITILFAPVQFEQVLQGEMPEDDHVEPIEQVTELLVFVELPQTVSAVAVQFDITILFAPVQFEQVLQGEMPEDDHVEPIEQVTELLVFVELPQTVSAVAVQFDITILFAPVQFEQVLQGEMPEDDHVEPIEQDRDTHDEFKVLPEGDTRPAGHEEHIDGSVKVFDVAPERAKVFAGHVKFPVQVDTVRPAVEP
jgi:hypothetical protein